MNPEDYITNRVDDQISWYDNNSKIAQTKFKSLRIIEVVCAAFIPLIAGFNILGCSSALVVSLLGIIIAICAALIGIGNYQENWIDYRTSCESLRHEKFLFLTKAQPYDLEGAFGLFVQRVEGMISKENSAWSQHIRTQGRGNNARAST